MVVSRSLTDSALDSVRAAVLVLAMVLVPVWGYADSSVEQEEAGPRWRGLGAGHSLSFGMTRVSDAFSEEGVGRRSGAPASGALDAATARWSIGYSYMPNPFFGAQFAIAFARVDDWEKTYDRPWSDSLLPTAGLVLSPLHLNWFGANILRVGVQGGLIAIMDRDRAASDAAAAVVSREIVPYYGVHLAYALWSWASLNGDARRIADGSTERTLFSGSLAIQF